MDALIELFWVVLVLGGPILLAWLCVKTNTDKKIRRWLDGLR